jgi:hypothetical protein
MVWCFAMIGKTVWPELVEGRERGFSGRLDGGLFETVDLREGSREQSNRREQ